MTQSNTETVEWFAVTLDSLDTGLDGASARCAPVRALAGGASAVARASDQRQVLGYFYVAQDARRALNGLKGQCSDMSVQPLPEPVDGRSWCLRGDAMDPLEIPAVAVVTERWNGKMAPQMG